MGALQAFLTTQLSRAERSEASAAAGVSRHPALQSLAARFWLPPTVISPSAHLPSASSRAQPNGFAVTLARAAEQLRSTRPTPRLRLVHPPAPQATPSRAVTATPHAITAQGVSRKVGHAMGRLLARPAFRPTPLCIPQGLNGLPLFGHHCIAFHPRTQPDPRRCSLFLSRPPGITTAFGRWLTRASAARRRRPRATAGA
ncbi:hypothetical protein HRbin22_00380 [Candidatus Thermoflexus japonica]|uniref:Uncharacterized protein n=1 Tax=Candidatus Thermoflexus japonica TaxID=2035417 RepID=A0A2H5Y3Z3_9CHLR|nr:hypothetical protein HRbin22_00380 [Candidatus Thermoflexus japonica]